MTPRTGRRGRPPKQPVESQGAEQSELGADPEAGAVDSGGKGEPSTDNTEMEVTVPEAESTQDQTPAENTADGEHTCSECGMSFPRRYSLIMHTLKHEKARGYKCSVSVHRHSAITSHWENVLTVLPVFPGVAVQ